MQTISTFTSSASLIHGFFHRPHKGKNLSGPPTPAPPPSPSSLRKQPTIRDTTLVSSEERAQKFHTDDVWVLLLVVLQGKFASTNH